MTIKGIGINAHSSRIDGDLKILERDLAHFEELGFDYVEIPVEGVDGVIGGRLNVKNIKKVQGALRKFHLKATIHAPGPLCLREGDFDLYGKVFKSSINFTWHLGAEILVYHGGSFGTFKRAKSMIKSQQALHERKEAEALKSLSDFAAERGVRICIENGAYPIEDLVRLVRTVDRKNVGITYDFGHGFLFYRCYGTEEDFLESIKKASPYLEHVHIHDNFGRLTPEFVNDPLHDPYLCRLAFGEGDLHLPPGMGRIPYGKIIPLLSDYEGVALMEIDPRHRDRYPQARVMVERLFGYSRDSIQVREGGNLGEQQTQPLAQDVPGARATPILTEAQSAVPLHTETQGEPTDSSMSAHKLTRGRDDLQ